MMGTIIPWFCYIASFLALGTSSQLEITQSINRKIGRTNGQNLGSLDERISYILGNKMIPVHQRFDTVDDDISVLEQKLSEISNKLEKVCSMDNTLASFVVQDVPIAKIVDSSEPCNPDGGPDNAIDDDPDTKWNPAIISQHFNKWYITFELNQSYTVLGVQLRNYGDEVHDITSFKLETSDNLVTWHMDGSVSGVATGSNYWQIFDGFRATGKYFKFTVTQTYTGWQPWLSEIIFTGYPAQCTEGCTRRKDCNSCLCLNEKSVCTEKVCDENQWKPVSVDLTKIKATGQYYGNNEHTEVFTGISSRIGCGSRCDQHSWCELWCLQADGTCLLRDLVISPAYQEESMNNVQTCFTKRVIDLATDVINVYGSPIPTSLRPRSFKENLIDGLQAVNGDGCYYSNNVYNKPYVMFDLGMEKQVHKVHIFSGSGFDSKNYFGPLEIRIGQTFLGNNDFSSYDLIGEYNDTTQAGEEIVISSSEVVKGRYLSIQQMRKQYFCICHIEIF